MKRSALGLAGIMAASLAMGEAPRRDINEVLRQHDTALLKVPGVVGICVGLLPNGDQPCLRVMLSQRTPQAESLIPRMIEGYPVVVEVTGEITPQNREISGN